MAILIRNAAVIAAASVKTNTVVTTTVGLSNAIAATETQILKFWVPFTVGATGGIRFALGVPAGFVTFSSTFIIYNTVVPSTTIGTQAAIPGDVTNPVANAGTHWFEYHCRIVNGVNAGIVDLLVAQNTADALSLSINVGATLEVLK